MILKKASKIKDFFEKYLNFFDAEEEKGIKERKWACIDAATYLVQPIRIISLAVITFFAYAETFGLNLGFMQTDDLALHLFPAWIWQTIVLV